jgi:ketosteroid isomerase-like protein
MSQENVERTRDAVEALNRGDLETALAGVHPDIEWRTLDQFPEAGTYRGTDEITGFFRSWQSTFRGFRLLLEDCQPIGDNYVVASIRVAGEGVESGVQVGSPTFFQLLEYRDGLLVWTRMFGNRDDALEAAGAAGNG